MFGQSILTALTFLMTLDGRTADRCTPVFGYRSVRLNRVPLQDSRWLDWDYIVNSDLMPPAGRVPTVLFRLGIRPLSRDRLAGLTLLSSSLWPHLVSHR